MKIMKEKKQLGLNQVNQVILMINQFVKSMMNL